MKALVTGANGFIGSFLVQRLRERGNEVRCFVLPGESLCWLEGLNVDIRYGDVCQADTLKDAVKGVDYVYHLAGVKTVWDETTYFRVNVEGTRNLVEAVRRDASRLKRLAYVSSQAAAGPSAGGIPITEEDPCRPVTAYGKSKRAAEEFLQGLGHELPITIVRPSLVYGPRNLETALLYDLVKWRVMFHLRHHARSFSLIHVRDAVEGIIRATEHVRARGQVYFISNPEPTSWAEIGALAFKARRNRGLLVPIPWAGVKFAAGVVKSYRRLTGQPVGLIDDKVREFSQREWVCSGLKAKSELGFQPEISLAEGIRETLQWYEESGQ